MKEKVIFTEWFTVLIGRNIEYDVNKFFKIMEKKLKLHEFNVFYNDKTKKFIITYDGISYEVILPSDSSVSLETGKYTSIVLKLMFLASQEEKYNSEEELNNVKRVKVQKMDESFYDEIETIDDYNLYLEYLKQKLVLSKSKEEKKVINTKIAHIVRIIDKMKEEKKYKKNNPLNLQNAVYRIIHDLLKKVEKLEKKDQALIVEKIKQIMIEYKTGIDEFIQKKRQNLIVIGDPYISMEILDKIVAVESEIAKLEKEEQKLSAINDKTKDIENELDSIISGSKINRRK